MINPYCCCLANIEKQGGKSLTVKERVEIDDENKLLKFTILEGDVRQESRALQSSVQAVAKEDGGLSGFVKWVIEYEKLNEDIEDPDSIWTLR